MARLLLIVACSVLVGLGVPQQEFQVNTFTADDQGQPAMAMDAAGNYVITWVSVSQDGNERGVIAQRFDAAHQRLGSEFQVNSTTSSTLANLTPAIAMDEAGNFVVVWARRNMSDPFTNPDRIYARLFDADGAPRGPEFLVGTGALGTEGQHLPAVAMDATTGNFVVAWAGGGPETLFVSRVIARLFLADGTPRGPDFQVSTSINGFQVEPAAAMNAAGTFVLTWTNRSFSGNLPGDILGQRFDANGTRQGVEFVVNTATSGNEEGSAVGIDALGNFVVAWRSFLLDGSSSDYFGQRFDAQGQPQGSEFQINTTTSSSNLSGGFVFQPQTALAMRPDGEFAVVWTIINGNSARDADVYARIFSASATPQGGEFQLNSLTTGDQWEPTIGIDGTGTVVAAWTSFAPDGTFNNVFARSFGSAPSLSITDASVNEGHSGTSNLVFTVTLSVAASQSVTVDFATADDTATIADDDYVAQSGTLTFLPGETSKTISVEVKGDTKAEPDEAFFISLSNAANAALSDAQAVGGITSDDAAQITVNEMIVVSDSPGVLPSAMVAVAESIAVIDTPNVMGAAMIGVNETILVTDTPDVTGPTDATPPVITLNAPASGAIYTIGQTVAASYSCADSASAVTSCAGTVANGASIDTSTAGTKSFVVNATDAAGNAAQRQHNYSVEYSFAGFFQPVANLPAVNVARAGAIIAVKWELATANGTLIGDPDSVVSLASAPSECDASPTHVAEQSFISAGGAAPRFDGTQWIYNWRTTRSWTGCRLLRLTLADGTRHFAMFRF